MSAPEGEDMQNQSFEPRAPKGTATTRKKMYVPPTLQDWGSITDLTQGGKAGFEDFPKDASGTRVV